MKNINKFEKGGLSGKPLEEKSNLLINEFYKIFKNKIKIIGVGGVDSGKSALMKSLFLEQAIFNYILVWFIKDQI